MSLVNALRKSGPYFAKSMASSTRRLSASELDFYVPPGRVSALSTMSCSIPSSTVRPLLFSPIRAFGSSATSGSEKNHEQLAKAGFKVTTYKHPLKELQDAGFMITTIQNNAVPKELVSEPIDRIRFLMENLPFKPDMCYIIVDKTKINKIGDIHPGHISFAITDEKGEILFYVSYAGGFTAHLPKAARKLMFDVTYPSGKKGTTELRPGVFKEIKDDFKNYLGGEILTEKLPLDSELQTVYLIGIPNSEFGFDHEKIESVKKELHKFNHERYYTRMDGGLTLDDSSQITYLANNCITAFLYAIENYFEVPDERFDIIVGEKSRKKDENYFENIKKAPSTAIAAVSIYLNKGIKFIGDKFYSDPDVFQNFVLEKSRQHITDSNLVNTEDYFQTAAIVKEGKLEIKDHLYPTKERISRHFKKEDDSK